MSYLCTQRTYRMPKDIHVEPQRFAAELISRLETVLREREAQERLEERLKRVRLVGGCHSSVHSRAVDGPDKRRLHTEPSAALTPSADRKKRGTMLTSP